MSCIYIKYLRWRRFNMRKWDILNCMFPEKPIRWQQGTKNILGFSEKANKSLFIIRVSQLHVGVCTWLLHCAATYWTHMTKCTAGGWKRLPVCCFLSANQILAWRKEENSPWYLQLFLKKCRQISRGWDGSGTMSETQRAEVMVQSASLCSCQ